MSGSRPAEVPAAPAGRLLQAQDLASLNFVGSTTGSTALANTTWYTGSAFSLGDSALRSKP